MADFLPMALLHLDVRHGCLAENRTALLEQATEAAKAGARLIVTPELAVSGYSFANRQEVAAYVEELTGDTVSALAQVAREYSATAASGWRNETPAPTFIITARVSSGRRARWSRTIANWCRNGAGPVLATPCRPISLTRPGAASAC